MRPWGTEYQGVFGFIQSVHVHEDDRSGVKHSSSLRRDGGALNAAESVGAAPLLIAAAIFFAYLGVIRAVLTVS